MEEWGRGGREGVRGREWIGRRVGKLWNELEMTERTGGQAVEAAEIPLHTSKIKWEAGQGGSGRGGDPLPPPRGK